MILLKIGSQLGIRSVKGLVVHVLHKPVISIREKGEVIPLTNEFHLPGFYGIARGPPVGRQVIKAVGYPPRMARINWQRV